MSVRYEIEEFFDNTVDRTRDFGFGIAEAARSAFCAGWSNVPAAIVPNPGDTFVRGLAASMCRDFPQPPPPVAPFTGGQCQAQYQVAVGVGFTQPDGTVVPPTNPGVRTGPYQGPLSIGTRRVGNVLEFFNITDGVRFAGVTVEGPLANRDPTIQLYDIFRIGNGPDNCGDPAPQFPGPRYIVPGDQVSQQPVTVEGDRNITIPVSIAPIFEEDVCLGLFSFCVDVGDVRATLDVGGITINLPGTGGGDGGEPGGGSGDTITNIDTKVTNIQEQQEQCCAAIIQSISSFRNRATELFNEAELRDACIVGLIRNSTNLVPRFVGPADVRASGSSGMLGSVRYIQPSRADSCFIIIEVTPTPGFTGKRYKILDDGNLVEASYGHAELVFLDGTTISPSETGIRTLSNRKTFIWFPYISSGNAIRLSLAGGLDYEVRDPGFRWSPSDLPTCEEVIDPGP